jgi:hypothetical protein
MRRLRSDLDCGVIVNKMLKVAKIWYCCSLKKIVSVGVSWPLGPTETIRFLAEETVETTWNRRYPFATNDIITNSKLIINYSYTKHTPMLTSVVIPSLKAHESSWQCEAFHTIYTFMQVKIVTPTSNQNSRELLFSQLLIHRIRVETSEFNFLL